MTSNNFDSFNKWEGDGPYGDEFCSMPLDMEEAQLIYRLREMRAINEDRHNKIVTSTFECMWATEDQRAEIKRRDAARQSAWDRGVLLQHQERERWLIGHLRWQRHTAQYAARDRLLQSMLKTVKRDAKEATKRGEKI